MYEQPNPEAWDDQLSAHPAAPADPAAASADADPGGGTAEYVSGESIGIEETPPSSGAIESRASDAGNGVAGAGSTAPGTSDAPPAEGDEGSGFLADLARAMQAAAGAERARSLEETDRRRETSIAEIRSKSGLEAADLEQQAEAEITEIGAWAETQMERIREERERRIAARREKLTRRLDDHRLITDRQVEAIEEAVTGYRTQLDAFFKRLDGEQDPGAIARLARTRPAFPPLEVVAGRARTAATADALGDESAAEAESPLVGVMDPNAGATGGDQPWTSPPPIDSEAPEGSQASASEETAPAGAGASARSPGALLGTVPALRPIGSWLHRDRNTEDTADRD